MLSLRGPSTTVNSDRTTSGQLGSAHFFFLFIYFIWFDEAYNMEYEVREPETQNTLSQFPMGRLATALMGIVSHTENGKVQAILGSD